MLIFGERAFLRASVTNGSTEPAEEEEEGRLQLELPQPHAMGWSHWETSCLCSGEALK